MLRENLLKIARRMRHPILATFRAFGGLKFVAASAWRQRRVLILCYHGVSLDDEHEWDPELFVTPAFLRRRFEILRDKGYAVLPLDVAVTRCANGTRRRRFLKFAPGLGKVWTIGSTISTAPTNNRGR